MVEGKSLRHPLVTSRDHALNSLRCLISRGKIRGENARKIGSDDKVLPVIREEGKKGEKKKRGKKSPVTVIGTIKIKLLPVYP